MGRRVHLITGFDSGLKLAARIADAVERQGAEPTIAVPSTAGHSVLGAAQTAAATARPVQSAPWEELVRRAAEADAVVPVFDGPRVERFIRDVHAAAPDRPPVFGAGYVGLVLYDVVSGYLMRSLADVVAVNSTTDLAVFGRAAAALGLPEEALLLCGLPLLPADPLPPREGPIRSVLFADQPTVPKSLAQRTYVWDRVLAYAERHPDRAVRIRPRHRPGEDTFHTMRHSPDAWAATRTLPANLSVDHTPIERLLEETDLLLTVSSTAALEAVAAGRRVAFVADFLNDAALNPPLLPSGLLRRFDEIDADRIGAPAPEWVQSVFPAAGGVAPADRLAARLLELTEGGERPHRVAWDSAYHRGRRRTDASLSRAVHGPTPWTARRVAAGALRRVLRRVEV